MYMMFMMRKWIAVLLAALTLCAACAVLAEDADAAQLPQFATMEEALQADEDSFGGWYAEDYVAVLRWEGSYLRVVAAVDDAARERYDAIQASIDYTDFDDYFRVDAEADALGRSLPVAYVEDISGAVRPQEVLDAAAGKTLAELEAEEYELISWYENELTGEVFVSLDNGLFRYLFTVHESAETLAELEERDELGLLTMQSASLEGWSTEVLNLKYHADGTHDPLEDEPGMDASGFDLMDVITSVMDGLLN